MSLVHYGDKLYCYSIFKIPKETQTPYIWQTSCWHSTYSSSLFWVVYCKSLGKQLSTHLNVCVFQKRHQSLWSFLPGVYAGVWTKWLTSDWTNDQHLIGAMIDNVWLDQKLDWHAHIFAFHISHKVRKQLWHLYVLLFLHVSYVADFNAHARKGDFATASILKRLMKRLTLFDRFFFTSTDWLDKWSTSDWPMISNVWLTQITDVWLDQWLMYDWTNEGHLIGPMINISLDQLSLYDWINYQIWLD